MKKLKLDLEQLAVDTFGISAGEAERGTAHAHAFDPFAPAIEGTGGGWTGMDTCYGESCLETCTFNTCMSCTATQVQ